MAMTKEQHDALLQQIVETDDKEVTMDLIGQLRTDYDEVLATHTEPDGDEYETKFNDLQAKYNTLHDNYVKRFFSNPDDVKKEQKADVQSDGEKKTFEKLFTEKEDK